MALTDFTLFLCFVLLSACLQLDDVEESQVASTRPSSPAVAHEEPPRGPAKPP